MLLKGTVDRYGDMYPSRISPCSLRAEGFASKHVKVDTAQPKTMISFNRAEGTQAAQRKLTAGTENGKLTRRL